MKFRCYSSLKECQNSVLVFDLGSYVVLSSVRQAYLILEKYGIMDDDRLTD